MPAMKIKLVTDSNHYFECNVICSNPDEVYGSVGEFCFHTAFTGYQEIISDPSYKNQIIVFATPHIGNTGVNLDDIESETYLKGHQKIIVMRNKPEDDVIWRSNMTFAEWCIKHNIIALYSLDTRVLVTLIRQRIAKFGSLQPLEGATQAFENPLMSDLAKETSSTSRASYKSPTKKAKSMALIDCGLKQNIVNMFLPFFNITIFPLGEEVNVAKYDAVFLSNGPGDPQITFNNFPYLDKIIKKCREIGKPLGGICLGHQLIAKSLGFETERLYQGHHGANHPVFNCEKQTVEVTSQNHRYGVTFDNQIATQQGVEISHCSLFDYTIQGIKGDNLMTIQYHPESSPGPQDSHYLFGQFAQMC